MSHRHSGQALPQAPWGVKTRYTLPEHMLHPTSPDFVSKSVPAQVVAQQVPSEWTLPCRCHQSPGHLGT